MDIKNHFLVAMPNVGDEYFKDSVIFICEHNDDGAMGLIINQPLDTSLASMLSQLDIEHTMAITHPKSLEQPVLFGGPVAQDRGFVLHKAGQAFESSIALASNAAVTTSTDILSLLGTSAEPDHFLVTLGYAGWGAGQLEQEIMQNSWLLVDADLNIIFNTPIHERRKKVLKRLGIDPVHLSSFVGHA